VGVGVRSGPSSEQHAHADARSSCFYARRALELAVSWLYTHDNVLKLPYQDNLSALIHEPSLRTLVGDALFTKARLVKDLGNLAVHSTKKVAPTDALSATRELFHFCFWLARTYGRSARPAPNAAFKSELLPKPAAPSTTQSAEQLKKLGEQLRERDTKLSEVLARHAALDAELQKLRVKWPPPRRPTVPFPIPTTTRGADSQSLHRPAAARGGLGPQPP